MKIKRTMRRRTYVTVAHVPNLAQTEIGQDEQSEAGSSAHPQICREAVPQAAFFSEPEVGPEHSAQHEEAPRSEALPSTADNSVEEHATLFYGSASFAARVNAAIAQCAGVRPSFFDGLNQTGHALVPAYVVMLLMKEGGDPVIDAVIQHPQFPPGGRSPGKGNLALLAIFLAAKPNDKQQRTWCYEWAATLLEAAHIGIAAEDFATWIQAVSLKECKAKVRKRRREEKGKILKSPKGELPTEVTREMGVELAGSQPVSAAAQEPHLEIWVVNQNSIASTFPLAVSQKAYSALVRAIQDLPLNCHAAEALWAVLDTIDGADVAPAS